MLAQAAPDDTLYFAMGTDALGGNPDFNIDAPTLSDYDDGMSMEPNESVTENYGYGDVRRSGCRFWGQPAAKKSHTAPIPRQYARKAAVNKNLGANAHAHAAFKQRVSQPNQSESWGTHFLHIQEAEIHGAAQEIRGFLEHPLDSLLDMDYSISHAILHTILHPIDTYHGIVAKYHWFMQAGEMERVNAFGHMIGAAMLPIPGVGVLKEAAEVVRVTRIAASGAEIGRVARVSVTSVGKGAARTPRFFKAAKGAKSLPELSAAEREFYSKAQLLGSHDYLHPGQLSNDMGVTFIGSRYKSYKLLDDFVLQRAGTKSKPFGQSFSFDKPVSELQTRIDKAVLPKWPTGGVSPIDTGFGIKIPKGSIVHVGDVANQGEIFMGGTRQAIVQAPWSIPGVEVVDVYSLQEEALWNEMANQFKR